MIKKNWYGIAVLCILLFAAFLRFYNYENRWGLAYDQAHDVLLARYALENYKIPLVGPFSSAGPFQTGGEWYWIIMAATAVYPNAIITPWIAMTLLSLVFLYVLVVVGNEIAGKQFGLMLGVLSAVSTAQIAQSVNLTNQTPLALVSLLAIWSMVCFVKKREEKYIFFLSLFVSLAASIHLQGASLAILIFATLVLVGEYRKRFLLFVFLGIMIPLIPLIIFDLQNNFINSKGFFQYIFHDQYKISLDVLGRRWLTYAGIFWPNAWTHVVGGANILGYVEIIVLTLVVLYSFFKKTISKTWLIITVTFLFIVVLLRYTRTPLFDSYIVSLHPFILLLTGWAVYTIVQRRRYVGALLFILVVAGSVFKDLGELAGGGNYAAIEASERLHVLSQKYPDETFAVYAYHYKWADKNAVLSLFLDANKLIDDHGRRIGVVVATVSGEFRYLILLGEKTGYQLLDLQSSTSAQLAEGEWALMNPSEIYRATQEWYKNED